MISTDGDQKGISSFSLPNSRLIITKLVAEDFKSYSGRHEIGPFHKSFTSIVGPNGSGKSNVIDAIMFVLGFRAKKMRQAKHADLIHNSSGMETVEKCRVQIYFQLIKVEILSAFICIYLFILRILKLTLLKHLNQFQIQNLSLVELLIETTETLMPSMMKYALFKKYQPF